MFAWTNRVAFVGLIGIFLTFPVHAEDDGKRAKEAMRRVQQANQKLTGEKAQLEQQKNVLQTDVDKLKQSEASMLAQQDQALREKKSLAAKLGSLEGLHAELKSKNAATEDSLRQLEADKKRLEAMLEEQRQTIGRQVQSVQSCEDKNLKLYQIGTDALKQYRDKSCSTVLLEAEPFTGLKKVETETLLQEYRDRLDANSLVKGKASP